MVAVRRSEVEEGAGEGIFAARDIETNTVVSFYNGAEASLLEYDPDTWETNNYKIFDPADLPDGTIDIPVWAQDSAAYCATLAHKTNHSFLPNSQFLVFDHPKYGLIPCISTIADIAKGEEVSTTTHRRHTYPPPCLHIVTIFLLQILVAYGYEWSEAPEWYKQAWSKSKFFLRLLFYAHHVGYSSFHCCLVGYGYHKLFIG